MSSFARNTLLLGGLLMALGIVFGAVGTHALQARLTPDELGVFETAVRYHIYNALGLLIIGVVGRVACPPPMRLAASFIAAGIVLFSGSEVNLRSPESNLSSRTQLKLSEQVAHMGSGCSFANG